MHERVGEGSTADWEQGMGIAHREHVGHVRDSGGVEAQRLVERRRVLPRVERRVERRPCDAGRGADRERARGGGRPRCTRSVQGRARLYRLGAAHGEERTLNMKFMFVTLEVSTFSGWWNADAPCPESREGHVMRGEVQTGSAPEVAADRGARSV